MRTHQFDLQRFPVRPPLWPMALLAAGVLLAFPARSEIILVREGRSQYEIVIPEKPVRAVTVAAAELRDFVAKSTGVELQIVRTPTSDMHHIFLGANPFSAAEGVTPDDLAPEGFHLKTVGRNLHIVGRDNNRDPRTVKSNTPVECGTMNGVYELLEKHLGVMFCWHDDLGTVVPRKAEIVIPESDITDAPDWSYRVLSYAPEGAVRKLYGRRLRLGHAFTVQHSHSWFRICPVDTYGEEHPEYFAEIDGKRRARHYLGHHGGQVCTTNPEVVEIFAQAAIDYFNKLNWRDMFSVSPNDGGGFCRCSNCTALDPPDATSDSDVPVLTDRLITFYNAIAERLVAVHPDKLLGAYIYSYYKDPPKRVVPHPNLALVHATNSAHNHGVNWAHEHETEQRWLELSKRFFKYDIYYYGRSSLNLIAPVTTHLIEKLKAEQQAGVQGGYLYIGQSYEQLGAGHYLLAKLMWDKDADARELERRYYKALYGPAAPDVQAYYHLLEERLRKMYLEGIDVDEPGVLAMVNKPSAGGNPGCLVAAYWPILEQATTLIGRADSQALTEEQAQRLERLLDQHRLLTSTVRGMIACGRLTGQAKFDPNDVAMLKEAVQAREAVKPRVRAYAPTLASYIEDYGDNGNTAGVTPEGAFYRLTRELREPEWTAVRADAAPVLDGRPDDRIWDRAPRTYLLLTKTARSPRRGARAALAYDDTHLYVLVEGSEPDTTKLRKKAQDHDDTFLFNEDNIELFLQPAGGPAYYHIALGAGGALYDSVHPQGSATEKDREWDSKTQVGLNVTPVGWSAELAVPFAALGVRPSSEGTWKINVYRTRRGCVEPDEYTAVTPTFGGYHQPDKFARLVFGDTTPVSPAFAHGTFDSLAADEAVDRLRFQNREGATLELSSKETYCGRQAIHIRVPDGGLGGVTLTAKVEAGRGYRALLACRKSGVRIQPAVRPMAPITRVIFRNNTGKAVTSTKEYSWDGAPALERQDEWQVIPHVFTTPPHTTQVSFTVFLHHAGDYWLDEIHLDEL